VAARLWLGELHRGDPLLDLVRAQLFIGGELPFEFAGELGSERRPPALAPPGIALVYPIPELAEPLLLLFPFELSDERLENRTPAESARARDLIDR
jgi:hypothetical protein